MASDQGKVIYKRNPAVHRKISDINPEKDIRVRILGNVIDANESSLVIDDGHSKAEVIADNIDCKAGDTVRVFARVLPLEEGYELRGEIIQVVNELDLDLYKKVVK
jgi:hypothetical protein